MTNPNDIVRVRARNGGRASVYEANAWAQCFSAGLLEGNGVLQNTSADMHVLVGGQASKPDVLIATNPAGYKIALDIVGQQAITITTPASNSRVSAIVAYTDDLSLSTDQDTVTGSPASCGLIVVNGSAASSPVAPTDAQIRSAITADGATGSQAAYCVIATITVSSATTVITDNVIKVNQAAINGAKNIADSSITSDKIDFATLGSNYSVTESNTGYTWIDNKKIYKKTISLGSLPNSSYKNINHDVTGMENVILVEGIAYRSSDGVFFTLGNVPNPEAGITSSINVTVDRTNVTISTGTDRSNMTGYVTIYYTKTTG